MNSLITTHTDLTRTDLTIGEIANEIARKYVFAEYREDLAANTLKRQDGDLALFETYLDELGVNCTGPFTEAENWHCVSWGLVKSWRKWQLDEGYSISSINIRLSTIKSYSKLAWEAGTLSESEYRMIKSISGKSRKQARNIDEKRTEAGLDTRYNRPGAKKSQHTSITKAQADMLKSHPDTPQGRRDALLMTILLDHGLRCGEVEALTVDDINLVDGTIKFYRPKVDNTGTHQMTLQTWQAAKAYLETDQPENALLMGSRRGGKLSGKMSDRAITKRVSVLGETLGIEKLSAHDCRHHAATNLAKSKSINELMDIFGWSSPSMAVRYVEAAKVSILE